MQIIIGGEHLVAGSFVILQTKRCRRTSLVLTSETRDSWTRPFDLHLFKLRCLLGAFRKSIFKAEYLSGAVCKCTDRMIVRGGGGALAAQKWKSSCFNSVVCANEIHG